MAQKLVVLAYLETGKSITNAIAVRDFGFYRLSDLILQLRDDYNIHMEMIKAPSGKRYGCYTLLGEKK